jgi:transcriptional regulator of nitric oxide reductase
MYALEFHAFSVSGMPALRRSAVFSSDRSSIFCAIALTWKMHAGTRQTARASLSTAFATVLFEGSLLNKQQLPPPCWHLIDAASDSSLL